MKNTFPQKKTQNLCIDLGENIKFTRLQKKLNAMKVAEVAKISRPTLWKIEKGSPHVALGHYAKVLSILGLEMNIK